MQTEAFSTARRAIKLIWLIQLSLSTASAAAYPAFMNTNDVSFLSKYMIAPSRRSNSVEPNWQSHKFQGLPFRILLPQNYDPQKTYPLVVFLHGSGEVGSDNARQLRNGVEQFATPEYQERFPAIVIAPQCPRGTSWGGYLYENEATDAQALVVELIHHLAASLAVDKDRIYLTGVSMGAVGTWDLIVRYPDLFAAALPVAGAGDPKMFERLIDFPIWAFHGDQDSNVDPTDDETMFKLIHSANGRMKLTEYPGVGHNSWDQTYANPEVIDWLFKQSRANSLRTEHLGANFKNQISN